MFLLARKNLFQEKLKFVISIAGVSFSIMLMVTLLGIYFGMSDQFVRYVQKTPADLVVTQEGVKDMFIGTSIIQDNIQEKIKNIKGVEEVAGIIQIKASFEKHGVRSVLTLTTYEDDSQIGKPWDLVSGTLKITDNQIILGEDFLKKNNLKLNDTIQIYDTDFTIAGTIERSSFINAYYGFITKSKGKELIKVPNITNYLFISISDKSDVDVAMAEIEKLSSNINVIKKSEFINLNLNVLEETFLPIVMAIVVIGFLVGTAIIGLTIYTATLDKQTEFGVLKAIGMNNFKFYKLLLQQSLMFSAFGIFFGILCSFIVREILKISIPFLEVKIDANILIFIIATSLFMSALSVLIPAKRIANIDPAVVFKS